MRAIADEAGLALGGIYNHFGNKEDIFVAILAERHPFLVVLPAMQAAQGDTVEALVRDAAGRMIAELSQNQEFLNLMLIELVEFEAKHIPMMSETLFSPLMEFAQRFPEILMGIAAAVASYLAFWLDPQFASIGSTLGESSSKRISSPATVGCSWISLSMKWG